jgi:hypothetical protein
MIKTMPQKGMLRRGSSIAGKITIAVTISVISLIATLIITSAWSEYADIGYTLSAASWAYSYEPLKVDLKLRNRGQISAVPTSTVYVVNATIQRVSIPNVAEYQLSKFCWNNATHVIIGNLTISTEWQTANLWASVFVIPDEGASSFGVYSTVIVPYDFLHPNNNVMRLLPVELVYNETSTSIFQRME